MKLSMWVLLDEMTDFGAKGAIEEEDCAIESARMFASDENLSSDYVYVGSSDDFFGDGDHSIVLVHRRDTITVTEANASVVLNRVISIFDKYRDWDARLNNARYSAKPFQAILDVVHDMFPCPMFFGHRNLRIYAITQQYPESQVYDGWDDMKELRSMPRRLFNKNTRRPDMNDYPETISTVAIPVGDDEEKRFEFQIRANCYCNEEVWGHLYLYYNKPTVSPSVLHLVRRAADAYGMLLSSSELGLNRYESYSLLVELLDGAGLDKRAVEHYYWHFGWSESTTLVLCKVAALQPGGDAVLFDWLCDNIADRTEGTAAVFPYHHSVIIIMPDAGEKALNALLSGCLQLISLGDYCSGVSFSFTGLENIASHYFQASYALSNPSGTDNRVRHFGSCALDGAMCAFKANVNWRDFIMPELLRLVELETETGTEYYRTLYQLLLNQSNLVNTARALYVHRNTVRYRMERISQLLGVDLQDGQVQAYLRFCCALLEEGRGT